MEVTVTAGELLQGLISDLREIANAFNADRSYELASDTQQILVALDAYRDKLGKYDYDETQWALLREMGELCPTCRIVAEDLGDRVECPECDYVKKKSGQSCPECCKPMVDKGQHWQCTDPKCDTGMAK